jgi:hypothetical protein
MSHMHAERLSAILLSLRLRDGQQHPLAAYLAQHTLANRRLFRHSARKESAALSSHRSHHLNAPGPPITRDTNF